MLGCWLSGQQSLRQGCGLAPLLLNSLCSAVLRVDVKRFSVSADVVKIWCTRRWRMKGDAKEASRKGEIGLAEPQPIWRMLLVNYGSIVSRSKNSLVQMVADVFGVCASFRLRASEDILETMCLMTKCMDRVTFETEAAGRVYKQASKFVHLVATVCISANVTVEVQPGRAAGQPTFQKVLTCHSTTSRPQCSGSTSGCPKQTS